MTSMNRSEPLGQGSNELASERTSLSSKELDQPHTHPTAFSDAWENGSGAKPADFPSPASTRHSCSPMSPSTSLRFNLRRSTTTSHLVWDQTCRQRGITSVSAGLVLALAVCQPAPHHAPPVEPTSSLDNGRASLGSQPADESPDQWYQRGAERATRQGSLERPARNIILFIGDGMSLTTVAAARILAGQKTGGSGEENLLSFERFPYTALSKTYNTDAQTPDSAGTMTAMVTGVKTRMGVLSVDQTVERGDCKAAQSSAVPTLFELAEDAGLATGVISTARITHATPGATYAHSADRNWEADSVMPPSAQTEGCRDIARQLIEFDHGDGIDVAFGGGRGAFYPHDTPDPEYPDSLGGRADGRNLITEWQSNHPTGAWVWNQDQFAALDPSAPGPVLGLFEPSHLQYEVDRPSDQAGEPSLADMTGFAIRKLASDPDGYVLVIEAGRIDHAHHAGNAHRALFDTIALSEAVATADELAGPETLILVTADHAHTLTFAGYPGRGNPILGLVGPGEDGAATAEDAMGKPYTTLSYANGPGYIGPSTTQPEGSKTYPHRMTAAQPPQHGRPDLQAEQVITPDYLQEATVPLSSETHGGEDVPVYGRGPGSQALRGVIEQNVLFHLMVQAQPNLRTTLCKRGACPQTDQPHRLVR